MGADRARKPERALVAFPADAYGSLRSIDPRAADAGCSLSPFRNQVAASFGQRCGSHGFIGLDVEPRAHESFAAGCAASSCQRRAGIVDRATLPGTSCLPNARSMGCRGRTTT